MQKGLRTFVAPQTGRSMSLPGTAAPGHGAASAPEQILKSSSCTKQWECSRNLHEVLWVWVTLNDVTPHSWALVFQQQGFFRSHISASQGWPYHRFMTQIFVLTSDVSKGKASCSKALAFPVQWVAPWESSAASGLLLYPHRNRITAS